MLARVKLSFTDTVIRFEHLPKDTVTGIGLEIHIKRYKHIAHFGIVIDEFYIVSVFVDSLILFLICNVNPICRIDYLDLSTELAEENSHFKAKSVYEPAACACKNLKIFGVSVHLDEFPEESRTVSQVPDFSHSPPPSLISGSCSPLLHNPSNPLGRLSLSADQISKPSLSGSLLPQIKIVTFAGHSEIKLKLKQNVTVPGPKVSV